MAPVHKVSVHMVVPGSTPCSCVYAVALEIPGPSIGSPSPSCLGPRGSRPPELTAQQDDAPRGHQGHFYEAIWEHGHGQLLCRDRAQVRLQVREQPLLHQEAPVSSADVGWALATLLGPCGWTAVGRGQDGTAVTRHVGTESQERAWSDRGPGDSIWGHGCAGPLWLITPWLCL
jgi:hypothetical protein